MLLKRLLTLLPSGTPSALTRLIKKGDCENAERNWIAAQATYAEVLALRPDLAPIWVQYGHSLKEQGSLAEAEEAYRNAIAVDGKSADACLQLGHLVKRRGRLPEARRWYQRATHIDPTLENAWLELEELEALLTAPVITDAAPAQASQYLPTQAIGNDAWKSRFKWAEFRILNPHLVRETDTIESAQAAFIQNGVHQLAPIALDAKFDPNFYRWRYPEAGALSDVEAYQYWLYHGISQGHKASEADLLQRELIGRRSIPANFDWAGYAKALPPLLDGRSQNQLGALEHLLQCGYNAGYDIPIRDGNAAEILELVADYSHGRGDLNGAIGALQSSLLEQPDVGRRHHKLADYHRQNGAATLAMASYRKALELGYGSVWTYLHLIEHAASGEEFERAYTLLAASKLKFAGEATWRARLAATIHAHFNTAMHVNRGLLKGGFESQADAQLTSALKRIARAWCELDDMPVRLPPAPGGHVVLYALQLVPQCLHYRVQQRCEQLDLLGIPYRLFAGDQPSQAREALVGARALIVYREPAYPENIRLFLNAAAMGIPTFYDIDDLIFDAAYYPDPFEHYQDQISYDDYIGLLQGRTLYGFAMSLCQAGIASTQSLCRHVAAVVRSGVCHHIPNGLDSRNELFLNASRPPDTENVFIFYGSGTRAHNRNFNEAAGPALVAVLRARPEVRLVVVGYLDLDPAFDNVLDQIIRLDFSNDLAAYWSLLAEVDINLALLVPGEMNDCKSEIKWLEAAVAQVPSVVSASRTYREALMDGETVLMAASPEQFEAALLRLVDDKSFRREVGAAAQRHAVESYGLESTAARLAKLLSGPIVPRSQAVAAVPRTRVLIVNVFFPPQTFGGATRVVRDNVDDLVSSYAETIDVAVATTDAGGAPGSSRVGSYGEVPVFRFAPALGDQPEAAFESTSVADWFAEVVQAWKPGIVHFHCIQYLTGSLPEVCTALGIPFVITLHDGWWLSANQFFLDEDHMLRMPPPRALLASPSKLVLTDIRRRRFLASQLDAADAVLAVSPSFAKVYRDAGVTKVHSIPNGLSAQFATVRSARQPRTGRVRVGHIAGWAHHKGIHLFQAALLSNTFHHIEAVVIDHRRDATYEMSEIWGVTPVIIRGKVDQEKVGDLYEDIDVLVAPSTWPESYGLISREALQYGLWVIASDLGALADDIVDGVNGFRIGVETTEPLVAALHKIDRDPHRFKTSPPPADNLRLAAEQASELADLYRRVAREWMPVQPLALAATDPPRGGNKAGSASRSRRVVDIYD